MFCTNCGKQVPNGAQFCPHCGAAMNSNGANSQPYAQSQPNQNFNNFDNGANSFNNQFYNFENNFSHKDCLLSVGDDFAHDGFIRSLGNKYL